MLALSQFVMTWVLGWMYLRKADREFDPLAERAREAALRPATTPGRRQRRAPLQRAGAIVERGGAAAMTTYFAAVNETALAVFAVVVGVTMVVTYFASKRVSTATDFWAAGRGLTGPQNGFAIAGDYMSAASFLGIAGLIFLFGFDGFLYSVGFLVAFLTVLFLLAERMRNSGKYTIADVLAYRLKQPARACRGRARHAVGRRLLPDRADGRRGCPDRGPGRDRLLAGGGAHRRVHDHLHRRRRHAGHELGADHQGVPADGRPQS